MSKPLFQRFKGVSSKEWKQKIQVDLKGTDYNKALIWKTNEGIDVKPFYHSDEFETLPNTSKSEVTKWKISQSIDVNEAYKANTLAKDAIKKGAEHVIFNISDQENNLEELVSSINVPIHINPDKLSLQLINKVSNLKSNIKISLNNDIIGNLGKTGNWYHNLTKDHEIFEKSVKQSNQIYIDLSHYQNAGANNIQQLAYAMAHCNEYLNYFEYKTTSLNEVDVIFNVAVGSNYFFEIGKIRALRLLWTTLSKTYNMNKHCTIITTPSRRNKTIYDYNVNMLRTTTECMSSVLGGADIICNQPYNELFQESTEFGERISRNQLLILKKESYFDAVNNPSDGSYYIENLTIQLSTKALGVFKNIEANGGFLKQLKEGTIQRKIKESAAKEQEDFDNCKITLLGTNKYPNLADKMKNTLDKKPFLKVIKRKTLIEPIVQKRLSEKLEINRLKEE